MTKQKPITQIFTSDWHFNHYDYEQNRGIITFERTNFECIEDHDEYLVDWCQRQALRYGAGSVLWFLGDFGDLSYLYVFNFFKEQGIIVNFILGNHDKQVDIDRIKYFADNIYEYPVFLTQKLIISHFPVAVYEDQCNIHGHLHGSELQDINHINASIHVANYQPITMNNIAAVFAKLPKFNRRFLYEPWAEDYVFTQEKEDVIMDRNGRIDLSASRLLQRIKTEERKQKGDSYVPYTGTL